MFTLSSIIFTIFFIFLSTFGRPVILALVEYVRRRLVHQAQVRILERDGEYIEGRYQPFGIPVRGYINHSHRHNSPLPGTPPFPSNEVWITTIPFHNDGDYQFFSPQHNLAISYLYYPQHFNRFYLHPFWNRINHPPNENPFPPVGIRVQVHTEVHSQGPSPEPRETTGGE